MKKILKKIICLIILIIILLPQVIFAQNASIDTLKRVGETSGPYSGTTNENSIYELIASLIGAFLGLLGVIFIILIILAGYWWMTANGDEQKLTKAKDTIYRAIIGLIITAAAYAITGFVFQNIGGGSGVVSQIR
jgi:amino acid transporter